MKYMTKGNGERFLLDTETKTITVCGYDHNYGERYETVFRVGDSAAMGQKLTESDIQKMEEEVVNGKNEWVPVIRQESR